jgi:hypothetical protein
MGKIRFADMFSQEGARNFIKENASRLYAKL